MTDQGYGTGSIQKQSGGKLYLQEMKRMVMPTADEDAECDEVSYIECPKLVKSYTACNIYLHYQNNNFCLKVHTNIYTVWYFYHF